MSEKILEILEKIPYSVSVVTVGRGGVESALTASWLSQVSFDPPLVMVAIAKVHHSAQFPPSTKNFVLNLLREGQEKLAGHFARESYSGEDKFANVPTRTAPSGAAILEEALVYFDCEVEAVHTAGDHLLVIGRVEDAGVLHDGEPLTTACGLKYRKSRGKPVGR
jgi:flavin reductase (DIM6/NTAB) family NADH-FMN oxidoreductase RutF